MANNPNSVFQPLTQQQLFPGTAPATQPQAPQTADPGVGVNAELLQMLQRGIDPRTVYPQAQGLIGKEDVFEPETEEKFTPRVRQFVREVYGPAEIQTRDPEGRDISAAEGNVVTDFFRRMFGSLPTEQEKAHLDLLTKTKAYRGALNQLSQDSDINISNLSELITFVSSNDNVSNNFNTLNTALETVPKSTREAENSRFTFKDLTRLRDILPESKKSMVKNLSVSATNKTNHSQVVFNEENEGANQSIAEKVMQSGAHPIMFQAQKDENNHTITDGGILDNMPSGALERLGLTKQEILCVKVNQADQVADQMRRVRSPKIETPSIKVKAFDFLLS